MDRATNTGRGGTDAERAAQEAEKAAELERKARLDIWMGYYKERDEQERQRLERERFYNRLSLENEAETCDTMLEYLRGMLAEAEKLAEATEEEKAKIRNDIAGRIDRYERQAYTARKKMAEEAIKDAADASNRIERLLQREIDAAASAAEQYEAYAALRLAIEQRLQEDLARINEKYWLNERQKLAEITAAYDAFDKNIFTVDKKMNDLQAKQADEIRREEERALAERKKAKERFQADRLASARKASQEEIAMIKSTADAAINEARRVADAEIAILEDKIRGIDALIKSENREDINAGDEDRLLRLKKQLEYETSDDNKYGLQKEIDRIRDEQAKRKRREALEDEKDALRQQIGMVKDSFAQRREAVEEQRDIEIQASRDLLEIYEKRLETETARLTQKLNADTEMIQNEEDLRKDNNQKFLNEILRQDERHSRDKRLLFNRTTDQILSDLYSRVNNFYQAGRSLGNAFATGYNEALAALAALGASNGGVGFNAASGFAGAVPASINIDATQNIFSPMATPSQAAKSMGYMLEDLARGF
jgi:hypothetical protein